MPLSIAFTVLVGCCIQAELFPVVAEIYAVSFAEGSVTNASSYEPLDTQSAPYGEPTGCVYDGKYIRNCYCPDDEYPYVGLIDGRIGAGMCLPKCNGVQCPAYPSYYWPRECMNGLCFVPCVLTLAPCPDHTKCYNAGLTYDVCLHPM